MARFINVIIEPSAAINRTAGDVTVQLVTKSANAN